METIRATFPITISPKDIKFILEGNMKKNSKYTCVVEFQKIEDGENVYRISSNGGKEAWYLIGMTASGIMQRFRELGIA